MTPHYAVKANNDPQLLKWLRTGGAKFDCASPREILDVYRAGGQAEDIVYAQPCKKISDLEYVNHLGIPHTVVDSPEEIHKLAAAKWSGGSLIRLLVPDAGSAQPFSRKFGAPLAWVPTMLDLMRGYGLRHTGWSFHVGSVCGDASQYRRAIEVCAEAGAHRAANNAVVDVGGGFVPIEAEFAAAAKAIREAQHLFPATTRWIGEPGRFLCGPVARAEVPVIGAKPTVDGAGWRYTVDESVYGIFSNIPFDGFRPTFQLLAPDAASRPRVRATIFGRTCDSADCLATDIELPQLRVGDVLAVEQMGAYTTVTASEFNGFPAPLTVYEMDEKNRQMM